MFIIRIVLPLAALLYLLVSPAVAASFWNKMMFFPTRGDHEYYELESIAGVPRQDVWIGSTHKSKLHGWFFRRPGANMIAVVSHGNGGSIIHRVYMVETLLKAGVSVLVYDYQGYGKSTGSPAVPKICQDGNAAYDFALTELGFQPSDIILVGESLGCGVTTEVAKKRPCAAVILQSGFSSLPAIAREKFGLLNIYPDVLFPHPKLDNSGNLSNIHVPVLVVHGKDDVVIPVHHAKENFAAANEPKTLYLIECGGHNDCMDVGGAAYQEAYAQFIQSLEQKQSAATHQSAAR